MIKRGDLLLVLLFALCIVGCGGGDLPTVRPADVDTAEAASELLKSLDTDGDAAIATVELQKQPGLAPIVMQYDQDADGRVTAAEITTGLDSLTRDGKVALAMVGCRVTLDGRPLSGATLRLVPASFQGGELSPAEGTTNRLGVVMPSVAAGSVSNASAGARGVQPGIYRVEITHSRQHVPAKYNTGSILALEVSYESPGKDIVFALTSR